MIVIFSGYNQRAVVAFLRTLKKNQIDDYAIVASGSSDTILNTKYRDKVVFIREKMQLDLNEMDLVLERIENISKGEKMFIAPSTEALNRFMLLHRTFFEENNCIVPLVSDKLYCQISDKQSFWELCKESGMRVPGMTDVIGTYSQPMIAKPRKYFSENGNIYAPVIIQTVNEFENFKVQYPMKSFMFQEYIEGESYYLLYYFSKTGKSFCLSQKNLIQQPNGKSMIAAYLSQISAEDDIAKSYKTLFESINFFGLVMVELRKKGDLYYMIEANPRFWGPSQLFCDSGYNFFEFFLHDYGFIAEPSEIVSNKEARYLWSGGITDEQSPKGAYVKLMDEERIFERYKKEFEDYDIYKREDTIAIYEAEKQSKEWKWETGKN